jgi:tRNA(Ile)-lysidine synthase
VPSPIGTFLLSSHNLSAIRDNAIRSAMIMRIMRYVSFQPWGSIRADGNRRVGSIQRIVNAIWAPDPHYADMRHFVAGSGVLWRPVAICPTPSGKHTIRIPGKRIANIKLRGNYRFGWLASRQPPFHKNVRAKGDASDPLTFDLTDRLCRAREDLQERIQKRTQDDQTAAGMLEILYDCRFIIRFDVARMPAQIGLSLSVGRSQIVVEHRTRWYWPQVTWHRPGHSDHLAVIVDESEVSTGAPPVNSDLSNWISIEWIRTLDAT